MEVESDADAEEKTECDAQEDALALVLAVPEVLVKGEKDGAREASPVNEALGHANMLELAHTLVDDCDKVAQTEAVGVNDGMPENVLPSVAKGDADSDALDTTLKERVALGASNGLGEFDTALECDTLEAGLSLALLLVLSAGDARGVSDAVPNCEELQRELALERSDEEGSREAALVHDTLKDGLAFAVELTEALGTSDMEEPIDDELIGDELGEELALAQTLAVIELDRARDTDTAAVGDEKVVTLALAMELELVLALTDTDGTTDTLKDAGADGERTAVRDGWLVGSDPEGDADADCKEVEDALAALVIEACAVGSVADAHGLVETEAEEDNDALGLEVWLGDADGEEDCRAERVTDTSAVGSVADAHADEETLADALAEADAEGLADGELESGAETEGVEVVL